MAGGAEGSHPDEVRMQWRRECWCGEPARGLVGPEGDLVDPHQCGQCSLEHCEHAAIARRCEFGICVREAELELVLAEDLVVKVCGLHVSPVLGWGVAEPIEPRIRYLPAAEHPDQAARTALAPGPALRRPRAQNRPAAYPT